jgi:hypothetical protein
VALKNTIKRRTKAWETLVAAKRKAFMADWNNGNGHALTSKSKKAELAATPPGTFWASEA